MTSTLLGSESWTNEPRYQNAYRARLDFVLGKVSVLTLQKLGSLLRNGLECTVSNNFSAGDFNLVKKITFEDEVRWIVRIRLPPISYFSFGIPKDKAHDRRVEGENSSIKCTERDLESLRSEIVTMKYLRNRSSIPIPRVHAYSLSNENVIGLPYIIMDYVHGTTAFNLSVAAGNPMQIPTQYFDHYSTQIAKIMVELASIRFERIGSLTGGLSSDTIDDVRIGPIAETGEGHYDTAQDFYTRYPAALARTLYNDSMAPDSGGGEIVRRLPAFLDTARESSPEEVTYGLANFELGTNNVLVNASFDILAVIDLDSVIAAPRAVLHHFPWCIGADPGIPGVGPIQAFGDWNGRMDMCRRFAKIVERVADVEAEQGKERSFSAIEFFGKEALGFRALAFFRVKQSWVDQEWVPGLDWMHKCSDGELLKWYGMEDVTINNT